MTKKKDRIITFILVLIIIILINAIINQFNPSLDLTRDKVYSLSKESKTLIKNIKEPMSVKFFITPNLPPPFSTYEKYVRDIFEEYKNSTLEHLTDIHRAIRFLYLINNSFAGKGKHFGYGTTKIPN